MLEKDDWEAKAAQHLKTVSGVFRMDSSEKKIQLQKSIVMATVCIDVHENKSQVLVQKYENQSKK